MGKNKATAKLKPCPFCGGPASMATTAYEPNGPHGMASSFRVICLSHTCPCEVKTKAYKILETAAFAWNEPKKMRAKLEAAAEMRVGYTFTYKKVGKTWKAEKPKGGRDALAKENR